MVAMYIIFDNGVIRVQDILHSFFHCICKGEGEPEMSAMNVKFPEQSMTIQVEMSLSFAKVVLQNLVRLHT